MARAVSYLALFFAYVATLFYLVAMVTPWWYTKYYAADDNVSDDQFYDNNPGIDRDSSLFDRTNCFIDGSCITGDRIYKNNSNLQWVYTTVLVLMIVGWVPWAIFLHLLHFRANKNRRPMKGRRFLMAVTSLLTMAIILTAIIVFAAGMTRNGVYRSGGLYGHKNVRNNNGYTGTGEDAANDNKRSVLMDYDFELRKRHDSSSAGSPASSSAGSPAPSASSGSPSPAPSASSGSPSPSGSGSPSPAPAPSASSSTPANTDTDTDTSVPATSSPSNVPAEPVAIVAPFGYTGSNGQMPPMAFGSLPYGGHNVTLLGAGIPLLVNVAPSSINGTLAYKYGAHTAWYGALLALAFIPLALLFGLCIAPTARVVTQSRQMENFVAPRPAVVAVPAAVAPAVAPTAPQFAAPYNGPSVPVGSYTAPGTAYAGPVVSSGFSTIQPLAPASTVGTVGTTGVTSYGGAQPAVLSQY